ncbi:oligosaccharide flippase family protein [Pseudoalteromonas sp. SG44-8]|uniref:oligosaccharide flippase family protein n=1 Tax=Pseudoalteromonas sp. SG44-8 TaxID=2760958 RepID=UPI001601593C|nr:oligosaccharide flippase family protein [Pseudoalteromonas sp. SG44-8]MBB1399460.1 oligosaccharide flippase family protein [Pseudoalteromonas sp. SG44-8]
MSAKKQFFSNLAGIGIIDGLNLLIPLLTIPILSRVLGPEEYGVYLLILTIVMFGYTFIDYSSNYVGVRQLSKTNNKLEHSEIFINHFCYRLVFTFSYIFFTFILVTFLYEWQVVMLTLYVCMPFLIGYALTNAWFYIGTEKIYLLASLTVLGKLVHLVVILLYVKKPEDLTLALHSLSLPTLIVGCILCYLIYRKYFIRFSGIKQLYNRSLAELKQGVNVFVGLLAPNLYNAIPLIGVAAFYSKLDYALLASAVKVAGVILIVQNVIAKALFPILSKGDSRNLNIVLLINLVVAIAMLIGLIILGEWLITSFLGEQYLEAYTYLIIMAISAIFTGVANTYGQGYFLAKGKDTQYRKITVYSSIVAGGVMLVCIYWQGLFGFVLGMLVARLILAICLYIAYYREGSKVA